MPQFPQLNKEKGDVCHLDGTHVLHLGVPFLALTSYLLFPPLAPRAHLLIPVHHRSVDFLLDSSLRKLYPSVEKPSSS